MTVPVRPLPTPANIDAAWERYAALVRAQQADPALMTDRRHCEKQVLAWAEWREMFLEAERRS